MPATTTANSQIRRSNGARTETALSTQTSFPAPGLPTGEVAVPTHAQAQAVFASLAPLLAAKRSMRLWDPQRRRFSDHARALTLRLPAQPAAVPLYQRRRTRLLGLDFDTKHHHSAAVDADVELCLSWISECGGRAITDRSTSGGRHILIPLPHGVALTKNNVEPIVRLLAQRLPTLDITPMLNDVTGALTPPGSRCKEGGYRQLDGDLDEAVTALYTRADHGFLGHLTQLLGATPLAHSTPPHPRPPAVVARGAELWEGQADNARLRAEYRRRTPMPTAVAAFAEYGQASGDSRWRTPDGRLDRSAARQSVLTAAVLQGMSLTDVHAQLPAQGGTWAGFARAYSRYGRAAAAALRRDWDSACRWAAANAPEFLPPTHKYSEHTGGSRGDHRLHAKIHTRWLAAAIAWADHELAHSPRRANAVAVMQGLAYASAVGDEIVHEVPVVEVGGRSLSLMAGSIPESTVWQILRDIREVPGAPLLRVRRGAGLLADRYALITPRTGGRPLLPSNAQIARARVEPVHPAWTVIGMHHRRLYEEIVHHEVTVPADALIAARMSRSAGYNALATLATTGLIARSRNFIRRGSTSLDDIAHAHAMPTARSERIARHRREREIWSRWLAARFGTAPAERHTHRASRGDRDIDGHDVPSFVAAGPPPQNGAIATIPCQRRRISCVHRARVSHTLASVNCSHQCLMRLQRRTQAGNAELPP